MPLIQHKSMMKFFRLAAVGLLFFALAALMGGAWLARDRAIDLVRPERSQPARLPGEVGIPLYQEVVFPSQDDLALGGWYVPAQNGGLVIFVHGLGGNRGELLDEAALLANAGFGILLMDLRNSGQSEGNLTTLGLNEAGDVISAVDFVLAQPGSAGLRVGLRGHSMGAATVLLAAARDSRVGAVMASAGYTSIEDNIADSVQQLTGLPPFPFAPAVVFFGQQEAGLDIAQVRPVDEIARIAPRPVFLVHGEEDTLILPKNSQRLYEAAGEPKALLLVPGADHGSLYESGGVAFQQALLGFFTTSLLAAP